MLHRALARPLHAVMVLGAAGFSFNAAGCSLDAGHDYAVTPSWLINGVAPTAEQCEAYNVDHVRLSIVTPSRTRVLEAPCDAVITLSDNYEYGGFDTTEAFDYEVIYSYKVDMLDAEDRSIAGYNGTFQVFFGDPIPWELTPLELFSPKGNLASFSAAWDVGSGDLAASCADAHIESVYFYFASITDQDFVDAVALGSAPCADGEFVSAGPALSYGEYLMKYVALDDRGAVVEAGETFSVGVDQAGEVALPRQRFAAE